MITIGTLLRIDPGRIDRSKDLDVKLIKKYNLLRPESWFKYGKTFEVVKPSQKQIITTVLLFKVKSGTTIYKVIIEVSPSFTLDKLKRNKIKVYCQCADFMYRAAYNLRKSNNIYLTEKIKKSLGQALTDPPKKTTSITRVCKHIYACVDYMMDNVNKLDLVIRK